MDPVNFLAQRAPVRPKHGGDTAERIDAFYDEMGSLPPLWLRLFSGRRAGSDAAPAARRRPHPVSGRDAAVRLRPKFG